MPKNRIKQEEKESCFYIEKLFKNTAILFKLLYSIEKDMDLVFTHEYIFKILANKKIKPIRNRYEFRGVKLSLSKVLFIEDVYNRIKNECNLDTIFYRIIYEMEHTFMGEIKLIYESVAMFYFDREISEIRNEFMEYKNKYLYNL